MSHTDHYQLLRALEECYAAAGAFARVLYENGLIDRGIQEAKEAGVCSGFGVHARDVILKAQEALRGLPDREREEAKP